LRRGGRPTALVDRRSGEERVVSSRNNNHILKLQLRIWNLCGTGHLPQTDRNSRCQKPMLAGV